MSLEAIPAARRGHLLLRMHRKHGMIRLGPYTGELLRGTAATKANGRQDEQDLQDGFCLRPTGSRDSFHLNPVTFFILSILFILSKNQVPI
jgi:hypothetical protein